MTNPCSQSAVRQRDPWGALGAAAVSAGGPCAQEAVPGFALTAEDRARLTFLLGGAARP